jgi:DNA-binding PadR family transcriptional regulator
MSAGKAVLGLVIQRPGYGYQLEQRVKERFGSAQFVASSIYKALGRLEKDSLIRVVGGEDVDMAADAERSRRIKYEATPEGVAYFRSWLRASSSVPLVREELQLRIAFCEPQDLPRLIEVIHGEELVCLAMLHEFQRSLAEDIGTAPQEWSQLMDTAVDHAEAGFWDARIKWLQDVRLLLEGLRAEAERAASRSIQAVR